MRLIPKKKVPLGDEELLLDVEELSSGKEVLPQSKEILSSDEEGVPPSEKVLSEPWKKISEWLQRALEAVQKAVNAEIEGVRTFLVRTSDGIKIIARHYSHDKITNEYEETDVITNIPEGEMPEELKSKISSKINVEVEITDAVDTILHSAV